MASVGKGTYIRRDNEVPEAFVVVSRSNDKAVWFSAEGDDTAYSATPERFLMLYREPVPGELHRLRTSYRTVPMSGEWFPDGAEPMRGWVNGSTRHGCLQPFFEKDTVLAAIEDGRLSFEWGSVFYSEIDDAFVIVATDGSPLPAFDEREIVRLMMSGRWETSLRSGDGRNLAVSIDACEGRDIQTLEGTVRAYGIGQGNWLWHLARLPENDPAQVGLPSRR